MQVANAQPNHTCHSDQISTVLLWSIILEYINKGEKMFKKFYPCEGLSADLGLVFQR